MGDDSEWLKLPAEEKVQHKNWKARVSGYEEVTKLFNQITEPKNPEFTKYAGLLKKFVTDNNAVAQEKALDAVLAFVENAAIAPRTCADVVNGCITKCLNASKQKTKDKGMEIIMLYIEIEKPDIVQDCLIQGLEAKQPKVVIGCIQTLRTALRDFGTKIISIKPILKTLPKLLEDRDKNVREETKQLIIEVYRWIGPALKPQMTHFNPIQVTELEAEFEKLPQEKPKQQRFMRSQQELKAKMEEQALAGGDAEEAGGEGDGEDEVDAFELLPAVDILAALPKDYYEKIEAKKWQERKEALEAVQKLAENPKLESGDYGVLVRSLLKVIEKDTNVMLVAIAAKCICGIAKGLRKKFSHYSVNTIQVVLLKFKEKKQTVVVPLREAIDAAYPGTTLDAVTDDIVAALENKNPNIKAETASFLSRCFAKSTMTTLPKKLLKVFCTSLLKTLNDMAPEVREASFQALGTAMKVVTEKHMQPYLADVDSLKLQKIQECCQNAVLLNMMGEPRGGGGKAASAPAPAKDNQPKPVQRPATAAASSQSKSTGRPQTAPSGGSKPEAKKKVGGAAKGKKSAAASKDGPTEAILSDETVEEKATDFFSADVLKQLDSSNWKERLAAVENMTQVVKGKEKKEIPCQVVVRTVNKKPGLKDTNFQVLKLRVDLIATLATNANFTKCSAGFCLAELVDKIGDVKNGSAVQEALSCIAEATGLDFVSKEVIRLAFEQKNPKNQSEAMNWLSKALKEFGFKITPKPMIEYIKKAFGAQNPAIRTAAITLVSTIYMYMGAPFRMFFEDEKAALLQQIDAEIEKVKGQKPPAPTRGVSNADEGDGDDDDADQDAEDDDKPEVDLIPRNDIGDKFTPELMEELADKGWKIRKEALEKITAILNEAKFIKGNLGPLPEALKVRLGDSNKILVNTTIGICLTLAKNMGPHSKAHIKVIGPALIACLGDSKPNLRAAAVEALNAWVEHSKLTPLVEIEAFSDALKSENQNLRQELLGWLSEKLPDHKQLPAEFKMCIPHLLSCLEDRNGEVRKKAQAALVPFMIHTGYDSVFKAASKLKPASKDQIVAILEKAKADLPAKQPKQKKAVAKSAPSASRDEVDADPEPVSKPSRPVSSASSDGGGGESKPAANKAPAKGKPKSAPPTSKKKKEEEDTGPPMTLTVSKEQRFKDEKNMKVLKWNFIEVRGEFVEQLKLQMEKNFSKGIMDQLFHSDFKFHTKAIEQLIKCLDILPNETVGNLDLILKWFTLRFYDTNPSMLNKALQYLSQLFNMLAGMDYHLAELEASSFIPYLVIKVGDAKDNVRRDVRGIFKLIYKVYPSSKMFTNLLDGLKTKNSKQRTECLEELGYLIEVHGISICQPTPNIALKTIAGQIGDRDNGVRNAALNTTVAAYMILGEAVYKYIGILNDKDQSLLDERIKRSMKNKQAGPKQTPIEEQHRIRRPSTGIPKSASSNSVKKEFALDVDVDQESRYEMPTLNQFDLDEIMQPVEYPKIKARPPSPSMRMVNSTHASTSIGMVISQITSADLILCEQALAQIDEVLKDEDKAEMLDSNVDQLLLSISMQLKMLFQKPFLATKASKDILKDLINSLVTILLDNRLTELEEGPQVVRTVNVMVVRIVEKSDCTNIMSALIRLLQDCIASETCSTKFIEMIMKCLWKMIRLLPVSIDSINIDRILLDTHLFLKAFPSKTWKDRPSDIPLRTIKTVIHTLAQLKGSKILGHMTMIDSSEHSESLQKPKRMTKNTHDMLAEIFKKIGSKENTREGLSDLYDFKKKYPDADLEPFLKKSSKYFQDYIERGLGNIELEREGKRTIITSCPVVVVRQKWTGQHAVDYYRERLRVLRARCGLGNAEEEQQEAMKKEPEQQQTSEPDDNDEIVIKSSLPEPSNNENQQPSMTTSTSSTDVSDLKLRLERLKKLARS
ncbi:hypothetical protein KUTeg_022979 [Tegillarca granosa]|uniref:TOG domain-containing protein n=1 Tax=Tegillarca granosa TaxID=220873 RepID=A0ABQ9E404_TEGGR|nr:hypothetical protein KUTeg_022979 [Tegillarca granosa]